MLPDISNTFGEYSGINSDTDNSQNYKFQHLINWNDGSMLPIAFTTHLLP